MNSMRKDPHPPEVIRLQAVVSDYISRKLVMGDADLLPEPPASAEIHA